MLSRFHLTLERHGQTDGRTDTQCQTDLLHQYRASDRERPVTHIQCYANNQR